MWISLLRDLSGVLLWPFWFVWLFQLSSAALQQRLEFLGMPVNGLARDAFTEDEIVGALRADDVLVCIQNDLVVVHRVVRSMSALWRLGMILSQPKSAKSDAFKSLQPFKMSVASARLELSSASSLTSKLGYRSLTTPG